MVRWVDRLGRNYQDVTDTIRDLMRRGIVIRTVINGMTFDGAVQVTDEESLPALYDLISEEGLLLGGSSAINVGAAVKLAEKLGPGHTIVTILGDSGQRYASKLFNAGFLRSKNLPVPSWLDR